MESLLLVLMLLTFAALIFVCVHQAFSESTAWGWACSLIPFSWFVFYGSRWQRMRLLGVCHGVALVGVMLALVLVIRAYPFVFDGSWLAGLRDRLAPAYGTLPLTLNGNQLVSDQQVRASLKGAGTVFGRGSSPLLQLDQVVFKDGQLKLYTAGQSRSLSVILDLAKYPVEAFNGIVLDLKPTDRTGPLIHVIAHGAAARPALVESFAQGYRLKLILDRISDNRYQGQLLLKLPDGKQGFVAGQFAALNKDLSSASGEILRSHDSEDTIEYIVERYLDHQPYFKAYKVLDFDGTYFQTALAPPSASTHVTLLSVDGSRFQIMVRLQKVAGEWVVETRPLQRALTSVLLSRR